ncbi:hypothetical protein Tco_0448614 [Tanacetum coccineum]
MLRLCYHHHSLYMVPFYNTVLDLQSGTLEDLVLIFMILVFYQPWLSIHANRLFSNNEEQGLGFAIPAMDDQDEMSITCSYYKMLCRGVCLFFWHKMFLNSVLMSQPSESTQRQSARTNTDSYPVPTSRKSLMMYDLQDTIQVHYLGIDDHLFPALGNVQELTVNNPTPSIRIDSGRKTDYQEETGKINLLMYLLRTWVRMLRTWNIYQSQIQNAIDNTFCVRTTRSGSDPPDDAHPSVTYLLQEVIMNKMMNLISETLDSYASDDVTDSNKQARKRDFLGLDGCFLSGTYLGWILTAVEWFLDCIGDDLDLFRNSNFTFRSDRQKGVIPAIADIFYSAAHRFCLKHIYDNMKLSWEGQMYRRCYEDMQQPLLCIEENKFSRAGKSISCIKCKGIGHNQRRCTNDPYASDPQVTQTQQSSQAPTATQALQTAPTTSAQTTHTAPSTTMNRPFHHAQLHASPTKVIKATVVRRMNLVFATFGTLFMVVPRLVPGPMCQTT